MSGLTIDKYTKTLYSTNMLDLEEKLGILAGAAKYDASCATSGSGGATKGKSSAGRQGGFGAKVPAGVCHSWTGDGRCVSLLKVLYSNACRFDCAYCANRAGADVPRASFTPDELVQLTTEFYRRNYIEGLFLSSGIFADPDIVMEKLITVAKTLRTVAGFNGYIHLKVIPGSGQDKINQAGLWADRLSANIELPTEKSLCQLAPQKSGKVIFGAMYDIQTAKEQAQEDRRHNFKAAPDYAPAGQSTQLIVGASGEDDRTIIGLSGALYNKFTLKRVYYSAYMPVGALPPHPAAFSVADKDNWPAALDSQSLLPSPQSLVPSPQSPLPTPHSPYQGTSPKRLLVREHRLYQADWLMRFYHFKPEEILNTRQNFLDPALDPKTVWALQHLDKFPIEIKTASYEELLRIPGMGATSARRVIEKRRGDSFSFEGLRRLGVVLKRARYFITLGGRSLEFNLDNAPLNTKRALDNPLRLRRILADEDDGLQLPLFDF